MSFLDRIALRKFRDTLLENLGMLVASGMPLQSALEAIRKDAPPRVQRLLGAMGIAIGNGEPLWSVLAKGGFLPDYVVSLLRIGEESGRLPESLTLVAAQIAQQRSLMSKVRSAMLYPSFVLGLMVIVGLGIAWFILPRLALVFDSLRVTLPLPTRILIGIGNLFAAHGAWLVPLTLVVTATLIYVLFFLRATRHLGQAIVFVIPIFRKLVRETEIARFGYLFGTLLQAGIPITPALDSLATGATFAPYRRLYVHLRTRVEQGESLSASIANFPRVTSLMPSTVQQLLVAAEQSGNLPGTLLRVGSAYAERTEATAKNLTVLLEPVLLVIIAAGVLAVSFAVILPIYSLLSGIS